MDITTTMDIFSTALDAAGVAEPSDRIIDGVSLMPLILNGKQVERECYFYYRDQTLHATRCGSYKAHFATRCGFCHDPPTWHDPPLLFNVDEDPGENYLLDTTQYQDVLDLINERVAQHNSTMVKGMLLSCIYGVVMSMTRNERGERREGEGRRAARRRALLCEFT